MNFRRKKNGSHRSPFQMQQAAVFFSAGKKKIPSVFHRSLIAYILAAAGTKPYALRRSAIGYLHTFGAGLVDHGSHLRFFLSSTAQ